MSTTDRHSTLHCQLLSAACFWCFFVLGLACICFFSFFCFWHRIHDLAKAIAPTVKSVKHSQANSRSCHAMSCIITNAFMTALSLISFGLGRGQGQVKIVPQLSIYYFGSLFYFVGVYDTSHTCLPSYIRLEYRLKRKLFYSTSFIIAVFLVILFCNTNNTWKSD